MSWRGVLGEAGCSVCVLAEGGVPDEVPWLLLLLLLSVLLLLLGCSCPSLLAWAGSLEMLGASRARTPAGGMMLAK